MFRMGLYMLQCGHPPLAVSTMVLLEGSYIKKPFTNKQGMAWNKEAAVVELKINLEKQRLSMPSSWWDNVKAGPCNSQLGLLVCWGTTMVSAWLVLPHLCAISGLIYKYKRLQISCFFSVNTFQAIILYYKYYLNIMLSIQYWNYVILMSPSPKVGKKNVYLVAAVMLNLNSTTQQATVVLTRLQAAICSKYSITLRRYNPTPRLPRGSSTPQRHFKFERFCRCAPRSRRSLDFKKQFPRSAPSRTGGDYIRDFARLFHVPRGRKPQWQDHARVAPYPNTLHGPLLPLWLFDRLLKCFPQQCG